MKRDSGHLYYGAISAAEVQESDHVPFSSSAALPERESVELSMSSKQHQASLEVFELQRGARVAPAPTLDHDVKERLREYGEPVCLFAEGPYERRERLRLLMARKAHKIAGPAIPEVVMVDASVINKPDTQARLFFTEGSEDLVAARRCIARYSLPRSIKRLRTDRKRYDTEDPFEVEAKISEHNKRLQEGLKVTASQVGADRPLAAGKFSPNDSFFATVSWSPTVNIWTVPNCDKIVTLVGHKERVHGVAWSPSFCSTLLSAQTNSMSDMKTEDDMEDSCNISPNKNYQMNINSSDKYSYEFSEGCHIATGGSELNINLWNLNTPNKPIGVLEGHEERINRVEFHPSSRYLASTSHDETWRLWDVETQKELLLQEGHATGVFALKFHPDGSLVITGDLGGIIRAWDLRTGRTVLPLQGHVKQILGISLNPRMPNQLATSSDDNTVRLWDLRRERCIDTLLAHDKMISEVAYEPKWGRYLVTSSYDCTLKVWNSVDLSCTRTLLGHEARVMGVDVTSDGNCIGSVSFDRTLKLWCYDESRKDFL